MPKRWVNKNSKILLLLLQLSSCVSCSLSLSVSVYLPLCLRLFSVCGSPGKIHSTIYVCNVQRSVSDIAIVVVLLATTEAAIVVACCLLLVVCVVASFFDVLVNAWLCWLDWTQNSQLYLHLFRMCFTCSFRSPFPHSSSSSPHRATVCCMLLLTLLHVCCAYAASASTPASTAASTAATATAPKWTFRSLCLSFICVRRLRAYNTFIPPSRFIPLPLASFHAFGSWCTQWDGWQRWQEHKARFAYLAYQRSTWRYFPHVFMNMMPQNNNQFLSSDFWILSKSSNLLRIFRTGHIFMWNITFGVCINWVGRT